MNSKLRSISRDIVLGLLGRISKPSKGVHLLNSHFLSLKEDLDSDYFDDQLKQLSKYSTIIPFEEAVKLIEEKKEVKQSLLAFSYDDGYAECYSHIAPVLEKHNGQGCFFINPNFVDGDDKYIANFLKNNVHAPEYKEPLSWSEIEELSKRGHIIGAHTMDHIRATDPLYIDNLDYQIGTCKEKIEANIGNNCDYFAFTYGIHERDFNEHSISIAENYYKYIFGASNYTKYYSYDNRIFNRRHCEPYWKLSHINYFISKGIKY